MKEIPLYRHQQIIAHTLIDDEDYDYVNQFRWLLDTHGYPYRKKDPKELKWIKLHRELMGFPPLQVDHKDRNPLNNQRDNLRLATNAQNMQNSGGWKNATSKHRGVSFDKFRNKWRATVKVGDKQVFSKRYDTEEEALQAVKEARREHMPFSTD